MLCEVDRDVITRELKLEFLERELPLHLATTLVATACSLFLQEQAEALVVAPVTEALTAPPVAGALAGEDCVLTAVVTAGDREATARAGATDLRDDKPATVHQSRVWQWCSGCQDMVPKAEFSKTQQKKSRDVAKCKTCIAAHTHPTKRRRVLELAA
jgi:flavoprotein